MGNESRRKYCQVQENTKRGWVWVTRLLSCECKKERTEEAGLAKKTGATVEEFHFLLRLHTRGPVHPTQR